MMLAYQPIRSLATINMLAFQGAAAFKRVSDVIDKPIIIKNEEFFTDLNIKDTNIKFNGVGFKYHSTKDRAIRNINIDIKGNTMTASSDIAEQVKAQ